MEIKGKLDNTTSNRDLLKPLHRTNYEIVNTKKYGDYTPYRTERT